MKDTCAQVPLVSGVVELIYLIKPQRCVLRKKKDILVSFFIPADPVHCQTFAALKLIHQRLPVGAVKTHPLNLSARPRVQPVEHFLRVVKV